MRKELGTKDKSRFVENKIRIVINAKNSEAKEKRKRRNNEAFKEI